MDSNPSNKIDIKESIFIMNTQKNRGDVSDSRMSTENASGVVEGENHYFATIGVVVDAGKNDRVTARQRTEYLLSFKVSSTNYFLVTKGKIITSHLRHWQSLS